MRNQFNNNYKFALGNALCETALSGITALPASGSYINVRAYPAIHIIVHLGTLHGSDSPVFEPKCSDAVNGTLDRIDATLAKTVDVSADDGQMLYWYIETATLPLGHHFISLAVSGTLTNGSYADVVYLLEGTSLPVTQDATVLPTDNDFVWAG